MSTAIVSLPYIDAFELSTVGAIADRYASGSVFGIGSGRTGNNSIDLGGGSLTAHFSSEATIIVGLAIKYGGVPDCDFLTLLDSAGGTQFTVRQNSDGTIGLWRGAGGSGTLLATSDATTQKLLAGFWAYVELKVLVNSSVGTYQLKINESSWLSATGVNTQATGNANVGSITLNGRLTNGGTITGNQFIDDFYISGGSIASPLNTFWGNQKIEMLRPSGPGTYSQFSRGGNDLGSNYREVQDQAQDGDATYVEYATAGGKDSYVLYDMAGMPAEIRYLQGSMYARKQDVLDRQNQFLLIVGGSEYLTCSESLSTSYALYRCSWQTDPATGLPFGYAGTRGVNNIELGSRVLV